MNSPNTTYDASEHDVLAALESGNWQRLRELSLLPGGFGKNRAEVWPFLLHAGPDQPLKTPVIEKDGIPSSTDSLPSPESPPAHHDERQVSLDTERSFVVYPTGPKSRKTSLKQQLHNLIIGTLRTRPRLHYFQGYHDIVSVLMLTLPDEIQQICVEKLSLHRIRDSMGKGLEPLLGQLKILRNLIRLADPPYAALLEENTPLPYFSLSNLLTIFSHDVPTLPEIQQIFDFVFSREPLVTVYLAAQILLDQKAKAFELVQTGEEGLLHSVLVGWPLAPKEPGFMSDILVSPPVSSMELPIEGSELPEDPDASSDTLEVKSLPEDSEDSPDFNFESPADKEHLIELCKLLVRTDELRSLYPPNHPSLKVNDILGPQSCIRTWSETPLGLPSDSYAEGIVEHPETVVFPYDPTPPPSDLEGEKGEKEQRQRRRRRKETAILPLQPTMIAAGAVMIIGVAVAIYLRNPELSRGTWRSLQNSFSSIGGRCRGIMLGR